MGQKKILVLGSGMVAKPCVDYLLRNPDNSVTVACRTIATAEDLVAGRARATAVALDVQSTDAALEQQIASHDVVISLVPFIHHVGIARLAIKTKTHVVTTSYVSAAMRELDGLAKEAGITILNEVGVDPGVDHLYAIKTIGEIHDKGGKVREFYSYCGGLPAPEAADNPLRFKFSWSPRGALLSQYNSATFLQGGQVVKIDNQDLMAAAVPYHVLDGYSFLAYPNRDSVPFREAYQIPEAETVIRGSLRYEGNPALVRTLAHIGWFNSDNVAWLKDGMIWAQIQQKMTGASSSTKAALVSAIDERCSGIWTSQDERSQIISGLRWMGLFSDLAPATKGNLLDTLSTQLEKLCSFQPGERDLVMLQHKFVVEWADGSKDTITSTLELFGDPNGQSAMSTSVGLTCGIATQLLLDGVAPLSKPGVLAPYARDICDVIRVKVEAEGIKLVERTL